jgi:choline dehydrogenase-like flavoprotein
VKEKIAIIGSGPSAAAAAWKYCKEGFDVTMIDAGFELEPANANVKDSFQQKTPEQYLSDIYQLRLSNSFEPGRFPGKLPFGSIYPYKTTKNTDLLLDKNVTLVTSLAKGGLSASWGGNISAVAQDDISDWPVTATELNPFFEEVFKLIDVSGSPAVYDALQATKIPASDYSNLCEHAKRILNNIEINQTELLDRGLYCGRAKIAIGPKYSNGHEGCVSCGFCMHGCPTGAIFNSADLVKTLADKRALKYISQELVVAFSESDDSVRLKLENINTGQGSELTFNRVFVGCGVFGSTSLVARSLNLENQPFTILDSQKCLFPFFRFRGVKDAFLEECSTLSQLYIQMNDKNVCDRIVHGQLYGFNDLVLEGFYKRIGRYSKLPRLLLRGVINRMMIGMVYLHSDYSGTLEFQPNLKDLSASLGQVSGRLNSSGLEIFKKYQKKILESWRVFGGIPVGLATQYDAPGNSQHFGGAIPMAKSDQGRITSDLSGRPLGLKRVHVVDSTVFPSIPGTPTLALMMANALRICDGVIRRKVE